MSKRSEKREHPKKRAESSAATTATSATPAAPEKQNSDSAQEATVALDTQSPHGRAAAQDEQRMLRTAGSKDAEPVSADEPSSDRATAQAAAMQQLGLIPSPRRYRVISPIKYRGRVHQIGDLVAIDDKHLAQVLGTCVVPE